MFDRRLLINIDWFLCFLVLLLCLLGFIAMSSVAGGSVAKEAYLVRQGYWFIAGIGLALLTQFIHYRDWEDWDSSFIFWSSCSWFWYFFMEQEVLGPVFSGGLRSVHFLSSLLNSVNLLWCLRFPIISGKTIVFFNRDGSGWLGRLC